MTKNQIIEEVYNSHIIIKFAKRFISFISGNLDDFCQSIYLILCELPDSKLQYLYDNQQLVYYIYYIVKAQATNPSSKFHTSHDFIKNSIPIEDYRRYSEECNETDVTY